MATARQRSGLRGVSELRKFLKDLPLEMRKEIGEAVQAGAEIVERDMNVFAPKDTGRLASLIETKMSPDRLAARVGFVSDSAKKKGFYARFIEFGTKGYVPDTLLTLKSGKNKGKQMLVYRRESGGTTHYGTTVVGAQPARPFIAPALDVNETEIRAAIRARVQDVIRGSKTGKTFGYE